MLSIGSDSRNTDVLEIIYSFTALGWDLRILTKYLWGKKKKSNNNEEKITNIEEKIKLFFFFFRGETVLGLHL